MKDKTYEYPISIKPFYGGIELFTYQLALGLSLRLFEGSIMLRLYFGPIKIWLTIPILKPAVHKKVGSDTP
jgi:hypothetical protein